MFKTKMAMDKSVRNYIRSRVEKKRAFKEQKKLLDAQLRAKKIELDTFERLNDILETEYYKQQVEEWAKLEDKIHNHHNS
jgi:hypothetical protein